MHDKATIAQGKLYTSYGAVSAVMWMLYDTAIHFDVEVDCIWRRPQTWVKYAYAFVRYIPILNGGAVLTLTADRTYPSSGCRGWIIDQLVVIECVTVVVEMILIIRVYAMYNRSKIIASIIVLGFAAEVALMVTTLALVIPKQTFTPDCLVASSPGIYMAYWLSSLFFETFLFVLTLYKFFQGIKLEYRQHSILFLFVRDGTWAYAIIFSAMLLNTLMYQLVTTPLAGMGYFWALSVMSFAGSHVLLNIRRLGIRMNKDSSSIHELSSFPAGAVPDGWDTTRQTETSDGFPMTTVGLRARQGSV
ncbi:uncharacterized protein PHACADRAFT_203825 [Phanerochaete carnosa HHB-10118-sp]|uniref:DUF6533 domain-containing protein n=1 Tax=Phanerochaete carnosa (strain HHB-10118-sp) TaxID=650164 RepID=K5W9N4_PHACS|nr:uncharacterized protein PHACADRAFT_203825 [Phanerochaete carnosa HHB-10118-sp]EKM60668.1 hypothetical protein PHACADRAFT_203825 [Phanerochaete carnosa HHB-10118-sp]